MIANLLISLTEVRKLGLLYLAIKYHSNAPMFLIFAWLIWQFGSSVAFGALSDKKGRKPVLYITIFFSVIVSLLARYQSLFTLALILDGLFVATLPIAFAAKNDQHPHKNKRITYAEASLARALPWLIFPWIYLWIGSPKQFWEISLLAASFISIGLIIPFEDAEDRYCQVPHKEKQNAPKVLCFFTLIFLVAFFIAECSYQTIPYLAEEKEPINELMLSYLLFGLGMSLTCGLQLFVNKVKEINLTFAIQSFFLLTFIYFLLNFFYSTIFDQSNLQNHLGKIILGIASGIYIPLIYAIVCKRFRSHQQGILCGFLDATGTLAEILAPALAYLIFYFKVSTNHSLIIIGIGFLISSIIIKSYTRKYGDVYEKNSRAS